MDNDIIDLYERHAHAFDHDRGRSLQEKAWLDRFLGHVRSGGTVLDMGCGMGEPIARYIIERGFHIVGVDSSPTLISLARERFPNEEWIVADMRTLEIERRFDGILAWCSFFHLSPDDQRAMLARFATHAHKGAPLMFTSGTSAGVAIGSYHGDPLYHASLNSDEYRQLLETNGFTVRAYQPDDTECGGLTVWLATYDRA